MVVNVIKWRPWPPLMSKKFKVKLVVKKMEWGSCDPLHVDPDKDNNNNNNINNNRCVEIKWKGPKVTLGSFRRTMKRNFTKEEKVVDSNGVVSWDEEFETICTLSGVKDCAFNPWEIGFTVFNGASTGTKNKIPILGTASLNLAEFASAAEEKEHDLTIPLTSSCGATESAPSLHIQLSLMELTSDQEPAEPTQSQSQTSECSSGEKDELSALKAGLRKVRIFREYVSIRRGKKTSREDDHESRSDEGDHSSYRFDSESLEESEEGERESNEVKEDDATYRKSFCYGTLAYANCTTGSLYEDSVYYSNRKSDVGCSQNDDDANASVSEPYLIPNPKRGIFPWKKRKLNLRSPKAKGEPLLKKAYAEEGGDDIDFDRRQLSFAEQWHTLNDQSLVSEFGDDSFAVGNWEQKEIISRDTQMMLKTQVFFASIDQRSERAAGESACTALVAVIADWFQNNHDLMPIKSQLDSLIHEGSLEWRNLCENEVYMERFPDKHFDLDTILEANLRPLSVNPGKSFIGFFHPEEVQEGSFDFLHGAMSFDTMWDEISRESEPRVYIVSWNDHFFVLKVDSDAYYIIDTLGERLFEGCNQAYILKFDRNTIIYQHHPSESGSDDSNRKSTTETLELVAKNSSKNEAVCEGKESCKVYLKSFLAAIPIRELQADMKKGLHSSTPLHHRLQIEFHYTQLQPRPVAVTESVVDESACPVAR